MRPPTANTETKPSSSAHGDASADATAGHYDVCVVGGTPGGIAAAVRAARGGYRVLLAQHTRHLGGMCVNGLGQWDAKSDHRRCPIFGEVLDALEAHYRETCGADSPQHLAVQYRTDHYPLGCFEPSVIERIFNALVAAEPGITVRLGVYPAAATVVDGELRSVTLRAMPGQGASGVGGGAPDCQITARIFIDATYEGDLLALAGAPWHVGREGREVYGEPRAGRIFTQLERLAAPSLAARGFLNLHTAGLRQGGVDPASSGQGDAAIQAYNARFCTCDDPANRVLLDAPPANYDRAEFLHFQRRGFQTSVHLNGKSSYNSPILPGENWAYPEADWATREGIIQRHVDFGLGLMWFLQRDASVSPEARAGYLKWGLPADEYSDHGHIPHEIYVREGRRLIGRHVLTETDLLPRPGFLRPRPFADSIAFTDWYLDSHSCERDLGTWGAVPGVVGTPDFPYAGKVLLSEELRPGMVPYRVLVTDAVRNLLVPVCASSSHIAWGSLRLEPTFIHLGEVAGFAACQALATGQSAARLDVATLQATLLRHGVGIAFFNDHRRAVASADPAYAERQLAACHGDWDSYDLASPIPPPEALAEPSAG